MIAAAPYAYPQPPGLAEQVIYGNGHLELDEVRVAAEVSGRVVVNGFVEGEAVAKGATLVGIDDSDLELQKMATEASAAAARAGRERLKAELATAQHHLASAQADVARARELEAKGTTFPVAREQAENALTEAKSNVAALTAQVDESNANIDALNGKVDLLADRIAKTQVVAPIEGTVLTKAVEGGEFVPVGQVVAVLGNLAHVKLRVYVQESDLEWLRLGTAARAAVDALPHRTFEASASQVDSEAQFTPREIHMPQERTRTVFGVTLAIDNSRRCLEARHAGRRLDPVAARAGWPVQLFVPQG